MNVSGEFTIKAPRAAVFETIRDPKSFIALVDGVRDLKEIDPTHYEAMFETRIAYLNFKFKVTVEVLKLELDEIAAKIEGPWLYARVDVVEMDGRLVLMELELTEPSLFFDLAQYSSSVVQSHDFQLAGWVGGPTDVPYPGVLNLMTAGRGIAH